jgi:hypothetical protein
MIDPSEILLRSKIEPCSVELTDVGGLRGCGGVGGLGIAESGIGERGLQSGFFGGEEGEESSESGEEALQCERGSAEVECKWEETNRGRIVHRSPGRGRKELHELGTLGDEMRQYLLVAGESLRTHSLHLADPSAWALAFLGGRCRSTRHRRPCLM